MSQPTPTESKRALRRTMRSAVLALPRAMRRQADAAIATRVAGLEAWRDAADVVLYHALPDEVDTRWLMETALEEGKRLYLPRIADVTMAFHEVASREALDALEDGAFGIAAPDAASARWAPATAAPRGGGPGTLVLCPGRAFDRTGNRLGRGGGYYDRFLSTLRGAGGVAASRTLVAGLCYSVQIVAAVPAEPGDQRVGLILTEEQVIAI
ncbi:MAG: 5-formyltetrahydrofolate cyclo-ligase [Spirochaetota bacterium]